MLKSDLMCLQQKQQQHDGCNLSEHYHSVRKKQLVHDRVLALIQLLGSRSNLHRVMDHVEQIFRQFELTVRGKSEEIIPGVDHFPMQTKPQSNFLRHYSNKKMREWLHGDFRLVFVFALTVIIAMSAGDTVRLGDQPRTKRQRKDTSMQPRSEEGYWQWPLGLRHRWERKLENFQGNRGRTDSNWVDWTGFGVRPVVQAFLFDQSVISSTALAKFQRSYFYCTVQSLRCVLQMFHVASLN